MRYSMFCCSLMVTAAAACGGDDGGVMVMPDAKVYMDAAVDSPAACIVPSSIPGGAIGTTAMPRAGNYMYKTMGGAVFFALGVFIGPRPFADEHHLGAWVADPEDQVGATRAKLAALAVTEHVANLG